MDLVPQFANTFVLVLVSTIGWFYLRGRFDQIDREFAEAGRRLEGTRAEVGERIEGLRADLSGQIAQVRTEMAVMRSDLTHVAMAVGARPPKTG